jgi:hypothetical protein
MSSLSLECVKFAKVYSLALVNSYLIMHLLFYCNSGAT